MHLRMTLVAKLSQNKDIRELEAKLKKEAGGFIDGLCLSPVRS